jgi:hypothetical protein
MLTCPCLIRSILHLELSVRVLPFWYEDWSMCSRPIQIPRSSCVHFRLLRFRPKHHDPDQSTDIYLLITNILHFITMNTWLICAHVCRVVMSDCQEMIWLRLSLRPILTWVCGQMSLGCVDVHVWSIETADGHGEGQV